MKNRVISYLFAAIFIAASPALLVGCAGSEKTKSTGQYLDDSAITAKVKTKLFDDPNTSGFQINVTTYKGVVQLSGFVNNEQAKKRATEIAKGVNGVKEVENNVIIKPAEK